MLKSRQPEAIEFQDGLTDDVLPLGYPSARCVHDGSDDRAGADWPGHDYQARGGSKGGAAHRAKLEAQRRADAPKVVFADAVSAARSSILVGKLAKILKGNGIEIGVTRLFGLLREKGYLIHRKGSDWNMPMQRSMEVELFEIQETAIMHSDGHVAISKTPKATDRGQQYFTERFLAGRMQPIA